MGEGVGVGLGASVSTGSAFARSGGSFELSAPSTRGSIEALGVAVDVGSGLSAKRGGGPESAGAIGVPGPIRATAPAAMPAMASSAIAATSISRNPGFIGFTRMGTWKILRINWRFRRWMDPAGRTFEVTRLLGQGWDTGTVRFSSVFGAAPKNYLRSTYPPHPEGASRCYFVGVHLRGEYWHCQFTWSDAEAGLLAKPDSQVFGKPEQRYIGESCACNQNHQRAPVTQRASYRAGIAASQVGINGCGANQ